MCAAIQGLPNRSSIRSSPSYCERLLPYFASSAYLALNHVSGSATCTMNIIPSFSPSSHALIRHGLPTSHTSVTPSARSPSRSLSLGEFHSFSIRLP